MGEYLLDYLTNRFDLRNEIRILADYSPSISGATGAELTLILETLVADRLQIQIRKEVDQPEWCEFTGALVAKFKRDLELLDISSNATVENQERLLLNFFKAATYRFNARSAAQSSAEQPVTRTEQG